MRGSVATFAFGVALLDSVQAVHLTDSRLDKVYDVMQEISQKSWENGTKAQAVLERDYPSLSVFASSALPLPNPLPSGEVSRIIDIAQMTLNNHADTSNINSAGGASLLPDGAAGDPASLGIAVLTANASQPDEVVNGMSYGDAASAELNYLLYTVPRTPEGAISHRADQAQLWSDSVFMVPPFLAYYGALLNNQTLLQAAYTQCQLYYDALRQPSGLWAHILEGSGTYDPGLWATGNAWAAYGMLRVLATIQRSSFNGDMESQRRDLQSWTEEILKLSQGYISSGGLLHNYLAQPDSFEDAAGSALMAAAGIRLSTMGLTSAYIPFSINLLTAVSDKVNSTGYLTQVVNPNDFSKQGAVSPEGQSFVIMAYAAYKEWDSAGRQGYNGSSDSPLGQNSGVGRAIDVLGTGVVSLLAGLVGWSLL